MIDLVRREPVLAAALEELRLGAARELDLAGPVALRPLLGAAIAAERPVVVVTSTYREAEALTETLEALLPEPIDVAYYPAWETLPHERLSPRSDTVGRRLSVLRRLTGADTLPAPRVVVTPIRALLQPQVKGLARLRPVRLAVGEEYPLEQLAADLVGAAYVRVDLVTRRGEFAVRGGIVDVFPPTSEHPVRIDFFGDEVEEIRLFGVADQRSLPGNRSEVVATPCRELLLTDDVRQRARDLQPEHPELSEMLSRIAAGHAVDGMEALAPALVDGMELFLDVLPRETLVLVGDPEMVRVRAADLVATSEEFLKASWAAAASGGQAPIDLGASAYKTLAEVRAHARDLGLAWWSHSPFTLVDDGEDEIVDRSGYADGGIDSRTLRSREATIWRGDLSAALTDIGQLAAAGWRVVLAADGRGPAKRLGEALAESGVRARAVDTLSEEPDAGLVTVVSLPLRHGVLLDPLKTAVLTAADLTGTQATDKSERKMPTRRKNMIDPLELKPGDPVVHQAHGVGRYVSMEQRTVGGATRDYLVIEYAPSKKNQPRDRLYVPMDQLDQVTRYVGGEAPALDRMGGADWAKRKGRARKAVKVIADKLIKLYAERQQSRGYAFGPDTAWQRELEDAFSYIETPDQLACIEEVKRDMEAVVPMDRLICGDVGYGKTEIAVRAAFKAVQDGKQVAVLVPTTLLVTQHYHTFTERYSGFPVTVGQLSRFQSESEAKAVRDAVAKGMIDVVIGTHRLLSEGTQFKDLGLIIIDEEQRFGVEHKEQLKALKPNVDVLSMSATPIPRTLEMAITGIREMSVIATPPEERHPVLTFVGGYDDGQITAAIRRELAREGQVFYIHNRVNTIEKAARHLRELVPEARVIAAHGQMNETQLEQVMLDFWERRADVLVCTTIVEAGLDISTANTLIIERADLLGLSQLHQLRGRVGRGRERAYAYFLYPAEKALTQNAHDRLSTMAAHADLGAGMAIAMKDLEIRGAGNLLGGEQSGHIADVGFDLYIRLVGEAVSEYRGEKPVEDAPDMRIELPVEANLPGDYVESERLRLEMYKRLAQVESDDDIEAVRAELTDRYGEPPAPALALLDVARFRLVAQAHGVTEVMQVGRHIRFSPAWLAESRQLRAKRLYPDVTIKPGVLSFPIPQAGGQPLRDATVLQWATGVITSLLGKD